MKTLTPMLALALFAVTGCAGADADGDGFLASVDCNDDDATVFPGALELCDGIDNDCNSTVDDGYAADAVVFFLDEDGDGYGTTKSSQMACVDAEVAGFVANASDCDDEDNDVNPGAPELCNLVDDDCNRAVDDNPTDAETYHADNDRDGFGSRTLVRKTCQAPEGWVKEGGDCNDFDFLVNPNALEYCDGFDNDCDDETDEPDAEDHSVFYVDNDGDGYGWEETPIDACYLPDGYAANADDCDDDPAGVGPQRVPFTEEICNDGVDNNCNELPDQCGWGGWEASTSHHTVSGSRYLGYSVDNAGDVDGDGIDDVVFGDYFANADGYISGSGTLVYGEVEGTLVDRKIDGGEQPHWGTNTSYDYLGRHVAALGDIDNDGYDDFGMGSYAYDGGSSNGGVMVIVYGDNNRYEEYTNVEDDALPSLVSAQSSAYLGSNFGPAGDQNGDRNDDMLVGAYRYTYDGNFGAGAVYLAPGSTNRYSFETDVETFAKYVGEERYTYLAYFNGSNIDSGDLDGDGNDDYVMGAYGYNSYAGGTFVFFGSGVMPTGTQVVSDAADAIYEGASPSQYVGGFLSQIPGDINDDGVDDLVVGHYRANNYAGAIYVYYGGATRLGGGDAADEADLTFEGPSNSAYLGYGRIGLGDFNGDGMNDLAMGAYYAGTGSGFRNGGVYLFSGKDMEVNADGEVTDTLSVATDADRVIAGPSSDYQYFGFSVSAGNFNDDGFDDLFVGEYGSATGHIFLGGSI